GDPGDTIFVFNGTYYETLDINKSVILKNMPSHDPIIDGRYNNTTVTISNPFVTLKGFTLRNTSGSQQSCAIGCYSSNIVIENCIFYRTKSGIYITNSTNISISNNSFQNNGEGIKLTRSENIQIYQNNFTHNGLGINIQYSSDSIIQQCRATINGIGIFLYNSANILIDHCATYNNNDNQGGIFLESSQFISIVNSIISHNGFGIKMSDSNNVSITDSTISHNTHAGILTTKHSKNIILSSCELINNLRISIHNYQSSITVKNNNIYDSICGIYTENGRCNVKNNWWGSIFGPGFFERKTQDNIKSINSSVTAIPWNYKFNEKSGANWNISGLLTKKPVTSPYERLITFQKKDSDLDGIPDWWEKKYGYSPTIADAHYNLDPDEDGLSNIEEYYTASWNSHPFRKDIFLEIDWMECRTSQDETNKPSQAYIQKAIDIFAEHNITLHIDTGNLGGGELIPYAENFTFADLRDYYWKYFLNEDINSPRKGIFRYAIICDYGPASGFAFIGWDSLDAFCISADIIKNNHEVSYPRQRFIIGSSIHELGHTLGLTVDDHGGNDNKIATIPFTRQWFKYLSYPSCMNYFYTYFILGFSDGNLGPNDFNDWKNMDFSFFKNTHFTLPDEYQ
ncbi:MAG: right-handed parallel beta-helix repeat-containing protein, partial [Candidatus Thermoplasmatota archaeon]|nr:right-handed parallel beta-helix repeat-containing protein [Candidatus Thermoplasmatota archaeon]